LCALRGSRASTRRDALARVAEGGAPDIPGVSTQSATSRRTMFCSSMISFQIDPQGPPVAPLEGDAPRAVHMDRIASWPRAAQRMKVEAGLRRPRLNCLIRSNSHQFS
jgi:hypothetical protein